MMRAMVAALSLLLGSLFISIPSACADRYEARVAIFYDDLRPYGRWVDHRIYGTIWIPASADAGWHPYTYGRWVWTTDYGWYWDSDEEFGWATYHYGRWVLTVEYGWAWVPDDVWGPAWVDWRYGDGYVGWHPMPPEHRWHGGGFVGASIDLGGPRYARTWVFVAERDFIAADVRVRRIPPHRATMLLSATVRVTNYAAVNGKMVNRSIDRARIAAAAQMRIDPVKVGVAASMNERTRIRASGSVPLYRPRAAATTILSVDKPINLEAPTTRYESEAKFEAPAIPTARGTVESNVDATGGVVIDRPLGAGIAVGGGAGGGLGGGLRLGR
jgi:hypothetical protein